MRSVLRAAIAAACLLAVALPVAGCSGDSVNKIKTWTDNFNSNVAAVNSSIAAVAPTVAASCVDLQKWAILIQPFLQSGNEKTRAYFAAANGAIEGYCQAVPTDINGTAAAVARAAAQAKADYDKAKKGG